MTPERLAEIRARTDAAPRGPYEWEDRPVFDGASMVPSGKPYNLQTRVFYEKFKSILNPSGEVHPMVWLKTLEGWEPSPQLAAFLAEARTDIPDQAAYARIDRLEEALEPFSQLQPGDLSQIGGGTLIAPSMKVQLIKDARAALRGSTPEQEASPPNLPQLAEQDSTGGEVERGHVAGEV